jgi:hypothetical protein
METFYLNQCYVKEGEGKKSNEMADLYLKLYEDCVLVKRTNAKINCDMFSYCFKIYHYRAENSR